MSIIVKDLKCIYNIGLPTETVALDGVSFQAERGEIISVVGHTGSGKSTLAQHLNALIIPQSGSVTVDGLSIEKNMTEIRSVRQKVGLVFQYPEQQIFAETVEEELSFGPKNWGITGDELDLRIKRALLTIGLKESILDKNSFELSGGQKRRVAIASVISSQPDYIVLDEPTAGLDASGAEELVAILRKNSESGCGIIHITHDLELALNISDKILVLEQGRSISWGTPKQTAAALCAGDLATLTLPDVMMLSKMLVDAGIICEAEWNPERLAELIAKGMPACQ